MTLVVWSKPLSMPTMFRPSLVTICTTLSTMPSSMAAIAAAADRRVTGGPLLPRDARRRSPVADGG